MHVIGTLLFSLSSSIALSAPSPAALSYCSQVSKVDVNPFREIVDGKELGYLLLLRSYISTDPTEPGVLSAYEFSPDGKVFTAKVDTSLKWPDGKNVTPQDVAYSIARQLYFRPLGDRVRVAGTSSSIKSDRSWATKTYSGIKIIDNDTFQLQFDSKIENLTGALREALSTNSRHNRMWPTETLVASDKRSQVLFKFPLDKRNFDQIHFASSVIRLTSGGSCNDSDFALSTEGMSPDGYEMRNSPNPSTATLQLNTNSLSLKERNLVTAWIRSAFAKVGPKFHFVTSRAFFLAGETGQTDISWPSDSKGLKLQRPLVIAYESPDYGRVLQAYASQTHANVKLLPLPSHRSNLDAQILASSMAEGRQIILQDILRWPHVDALSVNASQTRKLLLEISEKSASTVPLDKVLLENFEKAARKELSLVPLARRFPIAYTKIDSPICLDWTMKGELTFRKHDQCSAKSF